MTAFVRTPLVAGNWKMNTDRASALELAQGVAHGASEIRDVDLAVCPPFPYLESVGALLREMSSRVALGAQDVYHEPDGAFTGEVSTSMLRDLGVRYVLTGHSERRHVIGEDDALVARKTWAVTEAGLECILCVGETIDQRQAGETDEVNRRQVSAALDGLNAEQIARVTIAYEPVWAIGTGLSATPDDAQDAHAKIRALVDDLAGAEAAAAMRILYGGSVKPANATELLAQPDIDGGLIGGASLKSGDFLAIAGAALAQRA